MQAMTKEEVHSFLMDTARTGKLATVRADGRPHVTPIWFILDGDDLLFNTWHESIKAKNLQRDKRVSICVDDDKPPFTYVILEGEAELTTPPLPESQKWSGAISCRYMGANRAEEYGKRNGVEGEYLVRVKITKIIAHKNVSD